MADGAKLATVVAMLHERDQEFQSFKSIAVAAGDDEFHWPLSKLKKALGYADDESIDYAVNRAKIAASKAGFSIKAHFVDSDGLFESADMGLSKYAALLVTINADPNKEPVAFAQSFFALQIDRQRLEDEKRLHNRLEVSSENRKLCGAAHDAGVENFEKFNGMGISALYGGKSVAQIKEKKMIPSKLNHLDFAGSEELAANLFRITQTAAALRRQQLKNETIACDTHVRVARGVRQAIKSAGNTLPENLPKAATKIDLVATQVKKAVLPSAC